jgi:hypothetical protein
VLPAPTLEARANSTLAELRDALRPVIGTKNANVVVTSDAFHLCVAAGTLCEKPIFGVAFVLGQIGNRQLTVAAAAMLQFGELIGSTRDGFRSAFLEAAPRIQSDFAVVGRIYDVLTWHKCKAVEERQSDG